mmetsp:Transcript_905/g.2096  ORF Transcript_905/g.2096 Transcript_905/m.2096 type:complete len:607 (+) Transcript_905:74-1894(+)
MYDFFLQLLLLLLLLLLFLLLFHQLLFPCLFHQHFLVVLRELLSLRLGHGGHGRHIQLQFDLVGIQLLVGIRHHVSNLPEFHSQNLDGFGSQISRFLGNRGVVKELFANLLERLLNVPLVDGQGKFQKGGKGIVHGVLHFHGQFHLFFFGQFRHFLFGSSSLAAFLGFFFATLLYRRPFFQILLHGFRLLHRSDTGAGRLDARTQQSQSRTKATGIGLGSSQVASQAQKGLAKAQVFLPIDFHGKSNNFQIKISLCALGNRFGLLSAFLAKVLLGLFLGNSVTNGFQIWLDPLPQMLGTRHLPLGLFQFRFFLHGRHFFRHYFFPLFFGQLFQFFRRQAVHLAVPPVLEHAVGRVGNPQFPNVGFDQRAPKHDIEKDHVIDLASGFFFGRCFGLAVLVVIRSQLFVAQNVIGVSQFLKLGGRLGVSRVFVGVNDAGLFVIGFFDFGGSRIGADSQQVVILSILDLALFQTSLSRVGFEFFLFFLFLDLFPFLVQQIKGPFAGFSVPNHSCFAGLIANSQFFLFGLDSSRQVGKPAAAAASLVFASGFVIRTAGHHCNFCCCCCCLLCLYSSKWVSFSTEVLDSTYCFWKVPSFSKTWENAMLSNLG